MGAGMAALNALSRHMRVPSVQIYALTCLIQLTAGQGAAIVSVTCLMSNAEQLAARLLEAGAVKLIRQAMQKHSEFNPLVVAGSKLLRNLSVNNKFLHDGGLSPLVKLLEEQAPEANAALVVCDCLVSLAQRGLLERPYHAELTNEAVTQALRVPCALCIFLIIAVQNIVETSPESSSLAAAATRAQQALAAA